MDEVMMVAIVVFLAGMGIIRGNGAGFIPVSPFYAA
jgi:hypothetical protein